MTTENDPRWSQVVARDKIGGRHVLVFRPDDGRVLPAVLPVAAGESGERRAPRRPAGGAGGGLSACKRCKPGGASQDAQHAALSPGVPADRASERSRFRSIASAKAVGLSASYFHRLFKAATGLTPKDYAAAHRAARVRDGLAKGQTVTEAIYDAGFNSSGRFYEKSTEMLGMTPTHYRAGGANEEIRFAVGQSLARRDPRRLERQGRGGDPDRRRPRRARARSSGSLSPTRA